MFCIFFFIFFLHDKHAGVRIEGVHNGKGLGKYLGPARTAPGTAGTGPSRLRGGGRSPPSARLLSRRGGGKAADSPSRLLRGKEHCKQARKSAEAAGNAPLIGRGRLTWGCGADGGIACRSLLPSECTAGRTQPLLPPPCTQGTALPRPWVNVLLAQPSVPSAGEFFCEMLGGIASPRVAAPRVPGRISARGPSCPELAGGRRGVGVRCSPRRAAEQGVDFGSGLMCSEQTRARGLRWPQLGTRQHRGALWSFMELGRVLGLTLGIFSFCPPWPPNWGRPAGAVLCVSTRNDSALARRSHRGCALGSCAPALGPRIHPPPSCHPADLGLVTGWGLCHDG